MLFERRSQAPNGEDYLYVFYNRFEGVYMLMSYNIIAQAVEAPIVCHGFTTFDNGELAYFQDAYRIRGEVGYLNRITRRRGPDVMDHLASINLLTTF